MRPKLLLASLGLGIAAAVLPATAASAQCTQIDGVDGCLETPICRAAGVVLGLAGQPAHCTL